MMIPSVCASSSIEQGPESQAVTRREGLCSSRVIWHYRSRAERFIYVLSKIDEALHNNSDFNFDFAWSLLAELSPDWLNLRGYLCGPEPMERSADLDSAYMVLNRSRKGRPPTKKPETLKRADRYYELKSWSKLAEHNCEGKEKCNCVKSTRREVRRLIKYVESLDVGCEDFWDMAYIEENLLPYK